MTADAASLLGATADGRIVLGRNAAGCRHCGRREVHYATNGRAEFWHPGTTCCAAAVRDQISWRTDELQRLRADLETARQAIDEERRLAENAIGREAAAHVAKVAAMTRGYEAKIKHRSPAARELKDEIAELERLERGYLDAGGPPELPRPYRDGP